MKAVIKLKLKQREKRQINRTFAVERLRDPAVADRFKVELHNRFELLGDVRNIEDEWKFIKENIQACAEQVVGRKRGRRKEQWIQERTWQKIDERKAVKLKRDQARTQEEKEGACREYMEIDRFVKKSCRRDKKEFLIQKGIEAQQAADRGDTKTIYRIVNELTGNSNLLNVPIRDKNGKLLLSDEEQSDRWLEHFQNVLNQPSPMETYYFDEMDPAEELDVNTGDITSEETDEAIKCLRSKKAPGDGIQAELLKEGGRTMIEVLTEFFNRCWNQEEVPEDWKKGVIVRLPKKGNLSECGNWRGITLLSVPGKTFCLILLRRIRRAIDKCLREEQAGFRVAGHALSKSSLFAILSNSVWNIIIPFLSIS
ncbi:hypothetical protein TELCIR_04284 [Teladorsagia circumcincta]|uniref:Reverse transcriptase domain-containing protein n=1 Tax=Teladorsagia circumcincta TaxID=45464 RepID=A0A2G9UU13_TELCI|nr:hypothetical protein TELCIR_04284 [Teladorsagia circumcincta]